MGDRGEEVMTPLAYRRAFKHFIKVDQLDEASRYLEMGLKSFPKEYHSQDWDGSSSTVIKANPRRRWPSVALS